MCECVDISICLHFVRFIQNWIPVWLCNLICIKWKMEYTHISCTMCVGNGFIALFLFHCDINYMRCLHWKCTENVLANINWCTVICVVDSIIADIVSKKNVKMKNRVHGILMCVQKNEYSGKKLQMWKKNCKVVTSKWDKKKQFFLSSNEETIWA